MANLISRPVPRPDSTFYLQMSLGLSRVMQGSGASTIDAQCLEVAKKKINAFIINNEFDKAFEYTKLASDQLEPFFLSSLATKIERLVNAGFYGVLKHMLAIETIEAGELIKSSIESSFKNILIKNNKKAAEGFLSILKNEDQPFLQEMFDKAFSDEVQVALSSTTKSDTSRHSASSTDSIFDYEAI